MNSKVAVKWLTLITSLSASFNLLAADLTNFPPTIIASGAWGSIAPPALSQRDVSDSNGKLYRGWFDNVGNGGDLLAHSISSTGAVTSTAAWSASGSIASYGNRKIVLGAAGSASAYDCSTLALNSYICGDTTNEIAGSGTDAYRDRTSKLGAIIHSNPVYVGAPQYAYNFDGYLTDYRNNNTYKNREHRIYVGANDGMLHAFDTNGNELFGYIPGSLIGSSLSGWATGSGSQYLVDGPLTSGDVYADFGGGNKWKTLLVGGLGAGGKGYYMLDVTTPTTDSAANIATSFSGSKQWEFNPVGMGYSFGKPLIARTNAGGKWALIAPNGYAQGGEPQLYIRDITAANDEAKRLKDFSSFGSSSNGTDGNGLSSVSGIDTNNDYQVDYLYAGDLAGDLWRFTVKDNDPANWSVTKIFSASYGNVAQPIIAAPELALTSGGKVMVYVGTGDPWGVSSASNHSFYAIKDDLSSPNPDEPYDRTDLQPRVMANTSDAGYRTVDTTSASNYDQSTNVKVTVDWPTQRGWYTDLASNEQLLQAPVLNDARIQFMAHNSSSGDNWLTQLDYEQGLLPSEVIFDTDGDGDLDSGDNFSGSIATSVKTSSDLTSGPVLAMAGTGKALSYLNLWNEGIAGVTGTPGTTTTTTTYGEPTCSRTTFNRVRVFEDDYDITYTVNATLTNGDTVTASIDFDPDTESSKNPQPPKGTYLASAGAGSGVMTSDGTTKQWFGMRLTATREGSDDVRLKVNWHSPYKITSMTIVNSTAIEENKEGNNTCQNYTADYANHACTGTGSSCQSGQMTVSGKTIISSGSWNGLNASNTSPITTTTITTGGTAGTAATNADGEGSAKLQSGGENTTGRLRWRELLF